MKKFNPFVETDVKSCLAINQTMQNHLRWLEDVSEDAVFNEKRAEVLAFLEQNNVDLMSVNGYGDTYLHLILRNLRSSTSNVIAIMNFLIERGVDPNAKNHRGRVPLHVAVRRFNREVVDCLLEHDAKIDAIDERGYTAAHYFVSGLTKKFLQVQLGYDMSQLSRTEKDTAEFADWMISKGFDFDRECTDGRSAVLMALDQNLRNILPCLLQHTKNINYAREPNKRTLLQLFLSSKAAENNPDHEDFQARSRIRTRSFAKPNDMEIIRTLLERGVPVDHRDAQGLTAIHIAVEAREEIGILRSLISCHPNIPQDRSLCVLLRTLVARFTFKMDDLLTLTDLLSHGVDPNDRDENGLTAAYLAVFNVNLPAIKLLAESGADLGVVTHRGNNLFHALAESSAVTAFCQEDIQLVQNEMVDFLVSSRRIDANAPNRDGRRPLHLAVGDVSYGETAASRGRRRPGPEPPRRPTETLDGVDYVRPGDPLARARLNSGIDNVAALLRAGVEVNAHARERSALVSAIYFNKKRHVEALLAHGADIDEPNVRRSLRGGIALHAVNAVLLHSVKLMAANLACDKSYGPMVANIPDFRKARADCLKEIEILKNAQVDSCTSLYEWLHMDPYRRYVYTHSEQMGNLVASTATLERLFPCYSTLVLAFYRETLKRRALFEPAKSVWLTLTKWQLPDICLELVFSHLNTGYLFEFVEIARDLEM